MLAIAQSALRGCRELNLGILLLRWLGALLSLWHFVPNRLSAPTGPLLAAVVVRGELRGQGELVVGVLTADMASGWKSEKGVMRACHSSR